MAHNKNLFLDTMKANKKARDFMDTILGQGGGMQPADCEAYFQQLVQRTENVKTKSTLASRPPPPYHWNVEADMFAIAAHYLGQTSTQILTQLCKKWVRSNDSRHYGKFESTGRTFGGSCTGMDCSYIRFRCIPFG